MPGTLPDALQLPSELRVLVGICAKRGNQQDNLIALSINDFDRVGRLAAVPPGWIPPVRHPP
jgi:hypothetical protein